METVDFGYSADAPVAAERHGHVMIGALSVSDLTYDNGAGGRARATLIVPPRPNGTAVVLAHGGTADGRHYFLSEAAYLANRGMTTLLTAYSLPEEHGDQQATGDGIRAAVLTQRRALDVLTTWVDPPPDRLCYFGHSNGAFMGSLLSAVEPRLYGLALASFGTGTLRRLAAESMPQGPTSDAYLEFLGRFDPAPYVAVPGRRRLLFQHGRDDPAVLRMEAVALFEAAAEPRDYREYAADHDTVTPAEARADRTRLYTSAG
jgi:dipeptidyl aminopeptidase/acylaminoacyl peptidase